MLISLSCFSSGLVFCLPRSFLSFHTIHCMSFINSFARHMFTSTSPALYFCWEFSYKLYASSSCFLVFPSRGEDRQQRDKQVHACILSHFSRVRLFCDPMDCSPSGSSVHRISQARILQWVAIFSSRGSSQPRDRTRVSYISLWLL